MSAPVPLEEDPLLNDPLLLGGVEAARVHQAELQPRSHWVAVRVSRLVAGQVGRGGERRLRVEGEPVATVVLQPRVHLPRGLSHVELVDIIVPLLYFAHFNIL